MVASEDSCDVLDIRGSNDGATAVERGGTTHGEMILSPDHGV